MKKILFILGMIIICLSGSFIKIPNNSIRIRIIAASDSKKDQEIKNTIKKEINPIIYNLIKDVKNENEAEITLKESLDTINKQISNILSKHNYHSKVKVSFGKNFFPEKNYKGINYKSGYYKALVIKLDKGNGNNYWCVLYPPICLVDEEVNNYEYKVLIKELLFKYN